MHVLTILLSWVLSHKTLKALYVGLAASPLMLVVQHYLFNDWEFLGFLMVVIGVDTAMGVLRAWRERNISSRAFSRLFVKVTLYMLLLVLAHAMTNYKVHGEQNILFQWFDSFLYSAMMGREALSILENMAAIEPAFVPAWLLKRLSQFNAEGPAAPASVDTQPPL